MIRKAASYLTQVRALLRISIAMSRGAASAAARKVNLEQPESWEFSGFSQNGEDGILDVLLSRVSRLDRYFIEVGSSDGIENNTAWLSIVRRFSGLWIEGDPAVAARARLVFEQMNYGVRIENMFVDAGSMANVTDLATCTSPDVFSLDVDGIDFHLVKAALGAGLRPKILVLEYNSAFGPDAATTIPYDPGFLVASAGRPRSYFGCSIAAWRRLLEPQGFYFVTVDSNGVNAFFVDRDLFTPEFLSKIKGRTFAENVAQRRQFGTTWEKQFAAISHLPLEEF